MYIALMVFHSFICLLMIAVILFQRSEGGGLTSSSSGGIVSARGRADLLTRATAILATIFFITSLLLTFLAGGYTKSKVILDPLEKNSINLQTSAPEAETIPEKNI